jgi:hypothetical protein
LFIANAQFTGHRWLIQAFTLQAIAFLVGYVLQDIALALKVGLGGTALAFLLIVPPWPYFKRHPLNWLPVGGGAVASAPQNLVIDNKAFEVEEKSCHGGGCC